MQPDQIFIKSLRPWILVYRVFALMPLTIQKDNFHQYQLQPSAWAKNYSRVVQAVLSVTLTFATMFLYCKVNLDFIHFVIQAVRSVMPIFVIHS